MNPDEIIDRIGKIYYSCDSAEQAVLMQILNELAETGESPTYEQVWLADYKEIPVDKETFLRSEEYLGASNNCGQSIYPVWMDVMKELEATGNQYYEIVFTGATRTGKTSTAVSDASYQLYRIMCLRNPQEYFGLKKVTRISIFFFNLTETLAKGVAYKEFISTLSTSKWFQRHGYFTKSDTNPTYIPEGGLIEIVYGSAASHALGKATYCVVFDEVNFGNAGVKDILKAKKVMKEKYDTLVARVTGTFVKNGEVYGKIYVISSKNEDSDFMEEYVAKQREAGNEHMYVFDKPQWEVWPASKYSSDRKFKIALGGKHLRSFVVPDEQNTPEGCAELEQSGYRLLDVPEDNKTRFLTDFDVALRDIAGITVQGSFSFITQEFLDHVIGNRKNPFYHDIIEVGTQDNHTIEEFFHLDCVDPRLLRMPMFIHLDMSLTTDRTGISGIVISGRKDIDVGGKTISMPTFSHVFSIAVQAPRGDKIAYLKINQFICWLRSTAKANIMCVSRDQFQSEYMAQLLESQGFNTAKVSLDTKPDGYASLRSIILEQRIDLLHMPLLESELTHLKRDPNTDICDHPVGGCFTPDTLIQLADGTQRSMRQLIKEQKYFKNSVYTVNEETGKVEVKHIKKAFWSKRVNGLLLVKLNSGDAIQCTKDHRFMLEDNTYMEAQYLEIGTKLKSIYDKRVVVGVEKMPYNDWVCDLEIEDNPNFLLGAGVFVHNSKDVSDSVAGAVWEATLQNPGVPVSLKAKAAAMALVNGSRSGPKSNPILGRFGNYKKY